MEARTTTVECPSEKKKPTEEGDLPSCMSLRTTLSMAAGGRRIEWIRIGSVRGSRPGCGCRKHTYCGRQCGSPGHQQECNGWGTMGQCTSNAVRDGFTNCHAKNSGVNGQMIACFNERQNVLMKRARSVLGCPQPAPPTPPTPIAGPVQTNPPCTWSEEKMAPSLAKRKGYYRSQFESAWQKYCSPDGTTAQASNVRYIRDR